MGITHTLVQRHKSRGIKTWYIRTCTNGRESFRSTGKTKKVDAMKIFSEFVSSGNNDKKLGDLFVHDCASEFLKIKQNSVNNETTLQGYKKGCSAFLKYCDANNIQLLSQITTKVAQDYCNHLSGFMRPGSVNTRMQVAGSIYEEMLSVYEINARNPFQRVKKPRRFTTIADFWTMEQCDRIIANALNGFYSALWGLMAYAGLRFTEARRIRIEDIHDGKITIRNGKGGRDDIVPVNEKLDALLRPVIGERTTGSLFDGNVAVRNDKSIEQIKQAVRRAGITDAGRIYNHKFRHSFASELLRRGVNVKAVQTLGRWKRADIMLKHYAGVIDDDLSDAVNLL